MSSDEIREKYLKFFEERGHARIEPSPLVLENDPTTLFTSAGMQPLVPYLKGEPHPKGKRLVDIQPSFRTVDIDEVGDNRHLTFFEMLGNWSLGDYFKKDQLEWCLEFFIEELGLAKDKLWVSVFEGTKEVPKDTESTEVWKSLGIPEDRIFYYGVKENWWSRRGTPEAMPTGEIGGPDSEVFFEFDIPHDPKFGEKCHPNCNCGRFIEIGNSVFIQYQKKGDGTLSELPQKNVDFGGGVERIAAAVNNTPDIFQTDIFKPTIAKLEEETKNKYGEAEEKDRRFRVIADHLRAAVAIASEGVYPSNKQQGYILRRLIRRAALNLQKLSKASALSLSEEVTKSLTEKEETATLIGEEVGKFEKALKKGEAMVKGHPKLDPFDLYQSYGIPYEVSEELFHDAGRALTEKDKKDFEEKLAKHQKLSRELSAGVFKGGLADTSREVVRLHTATHLIHAALRKILGEHVSQKGSNITSERLRFDFSHPEKLSEEEIKKIEDLVNEQIEKDLQVSFEEKTYDEASQEGALAFFGEKYGKKVKMYTIGDFSKEVCGGPHVKSTSEIGHVKIIKQEKLGAGVVRIYATIEVK
ncbi:alanine--tRNA ligase [Candidatus Woesebacteria bacterium]|nr:alanine--tRNA ligase [Candidatus Woesebacteria bacterium]